MRVLLATTAVAATIAVTPKSYAAIDDMPTHVPEFFSDDVGLTELLIGYYYVAEICATFEFDIPLRDLPAIRDFVVYVYTEAGFDRQYVNETYDRIERNTYYLDIPTIDECPRARRIFSDQNGNPIGKQIKKF